MLFPFLIFTMMNQTQICVEISATLTRLIVALRVAAVSAQTSHWTCSGENYYSDHLLFQRIYEADDGDIDAIAERSVALAGIHVVNPVLIADDVAECLAGLIRIENPIQRQLCAERCVVICAQDLMTAFAEQLTTSLGWDDILGSIVAKREEHQYLLQRRLGVEL